MGENWCLSRHFFSSFFTKKHSKVLFHILYDVFSFLSFFEWLFFWHQPDAPDLEILHSFLIFIFFRHVSAECWCLWKTEFWNGLKYVAIIWKVVWIKIETITKFEGIMISLISITHNLCKNGQVKCRITKLKKLDLANELHTNCRFWSKCEGLIISTILLPFIVKYIIHIYL